MAHLGTGRLMETIGIRQAGSVREALRGFGAYRAQFVGGFAHLMSIGERV